MVSFKIHSLKVLQIVSRLNFTCGVNITTIGNFKIYFCSSYFYKKTYVEPISKKNSTKQMGSRAKRAYIIHNLHQDLSHDK